tara:strand:- start:1335 stop:2663 length:1329 start_codon:yes stop_codon:yes gene_type:complete
MRLEQISFDKSIKGFERIGVAYSGGLDSTVLLHALSQEITFKNKINAIHVNHSISPNSDKWEEFCRKNADELGVKFFSYKLEELKNISEDNLRKIRYEKFNQWASYNDLILTAHHKDDQVETILFRVIRGTGLNGLKGIPAWRKDENIQFHRPLLDVSKRELYEYALTNKLKWVEDESNKDIKISRNFIRNKLLPTIRDKWPNVDKSILHLSSEAKRSNKILKSVAKEDLEGLVTKENSYNLYKYLSLPEERAENLLYFLINYEIGLEATSDYLKEIDRSLRNSKNLDNLEFPLTNKDKNRVFKLKVLEGEICFLSEGEFHKLDSSYVSSWDLNSKLEIPSGFLNVEKIKGKGIDDLYWQQQIYVKGRTGGERCKPFGRNKSQKLKKLFQEYEIPLWQRDRLPLIYIGEKLAAVGDLWVCEEFHTQPSKRGISINWTDNLTI